MKGGKERITGERTGTRSQRRKIKGYGEKSKGADRVKGENKMDEGEKHVKGKMKDYWGK